VESYNILCVADAGAVAATVTVADPVADAVAATVSVAEAVALAGAEAEAVAATAAIAVATAVINFKYPLWNHTISSWSLRPQPKPLP
jgi:hypothetical protein